MIEFYSFFLEIKCANNEQEIPFEKCISDQSEGKAFVEIGGTKLRLNDLVPEFSTCKIISGESLLIGKKLGEVLLFVISPLLLKFCREDLA